MPQHVAAGPVEDAAGQGKKGAGGTQAADAWSCCAEAAAAAKLAMRVEAAAGGDWQLPMNQHTCPESQQPVHAEGHGVRLELTKMQMQRKSSISHRRQELKQRNKSCRPHADRQIPCCNAELAG